MGGYELRTKQPESKDSGFFMPRSFFIFLGGWAHKPQAARGGWAHKSQASVIIYDYYFILLWDFIV